MTTITLSEEVTLRRKLGNGGAGFTTPQLNDIWVEAGESMSKAVMICFEDLMNDAARFADYTQNETQEKRSQIFDHIANKVLPYWQKKVAEEEALANPSRRAARVLGTRVVPPRRIERPATDPGDDGDGWVN